VNFLSIAIWVAAVAPYSVCCGELASFFAPYQLRPGNREELKKYLQAVG
jgi:hypothetical protein